MLNYLKRRRDARHQFRKLVHRQEELARQDEPDETPVPRRYLPFDKLALIVYQWGFWLAPSWWWFDAGKRYQVDPGQTWDTRRRKLEEQEAHTALYVTAWLLILVAIWLCSPADDTVAVVFGIVALFRLFEIALSVLGFLLDQREPRIARSLVTIGALALQVALIFAILAHSFAPDGFLKPEAVAPRGAPADSPFEYLYLSWTYMTTVGNQYTPASELARILQLGASTSGILLVGIVAARAIGLVGATNKIASNLESRVASLEADEARRQQGAEGGSS